MSIHHASDKRMPQPLELQLDREMQPDPKVSGATRCRRCGWLPVVGPLYDHTYKEALDYRCRCGAVVTRDVPVRAYTTWEADHEEGP